MDMFPSVVCEVTQTPPSPQCSARPTSHGALHSPPVCPLGPPSTCSAMQKPSSGGFWHWPSTVQGEPINPGGAGGPGLGLGNGLSQQTLADRPGIPTHSYPARQSDGLWQPCQQATSYSPNWRQTPRQ